MTEEEKFEFGMFVIRSLQEAMEVERIITDEAEALAWAEKYSEARKVLEEAKPRANEDQRNRIEKFIATIDKVESSSTEPQEPCDLDRTVEGE